LLWDKIIGCEDRVSLNLGVVSLAHGTFLLSKILSITPYRDK